MKNKVHQGQSYLDKVLELTGSVENAFEMALMNDVSITHIPAIGDEFKPSSVTRKGVVLFFEGDNIPATAEKSTPDILNVLNYKLPGELPYSL